MLKNWKAILILLVVLVLAGFGIKFAFFGFWQGYSDGQRIGQLHQFTQKGVYRVGKGELLINEFGVAGGGPGATTQGNNWAFNVSDDELIAKLKTMIGQQVIVDYREWWRSPWYMTTDYEVVGVRPASGTDGASPSSEP